MTTLQKLRQRFRKVGPKKSSKSHHSRTRSHQTREFLDTNTTESTESRTHKRAAARGSASGNADGASAIANGANASANHASSTSDISRQTFCSPSSTENSPASNPSARTDEVWQFRGQSTSGDETVSTSMANPGSHEGGDLSCTGAVGVESSSTSHFGSMPNGEPSLATDSVSNLSDEERHLISITSYVVDMLPENVVKCLLNLKRRGIKVTRDNLFDESFSNRSKFPNKPSQTLSFPQPNFLHRPSESGRSGLTGSADRTNGTPASGQRSPAQAAGASSSVPHQGNSSSSLGNGAAIPAEGRMDRRYSQTASNQGATGSSLRGAVKSSSPAAAYQNKVNHVSSRSSASDGRGPRDSSVDPPIGATPSEPAANHRAMQPAHSESSVPANKVSGSSGQVSGGTSNALQTAYIPHFSSATVEDGAMASQEPMNDLNRESQTSQRDAESVSDLPLKERDPDEYLATCLRLVRDEYKKLDIDRHCGECGNNPRDITFLPCGHVWSCRSCAVPLYVCPCCGKNIIATVDTFMC